MHKKLKLVKENATEKYWDATEIDRQGFVTLMKFNFGTDNKGNNYIVTNDNNEAGRFRADSDEEAKKKFREEFLKESVEIDHYEKCDNCGKEVGVYTDGSTDLVIDNGKYYCEKCALELGLLESTLTEAEDEEKEEEIEQVEDDLEDTLDSEENQEENPVEEESELDKQLDELRKVLIDLDLNLYQVTSKEDPNNSIYIIGKVAEDNNDTLMLIDTKPEEHDDIKIEDEPIEPEINQEEEVEQPEEVLDNIPNEENDVVEPDEKEEPVEQELETPEERFDFVVLPKTFAEINELNPRYGEDLTPDHEAIMDYLMNCLIEIDPEAAEEIQDELVGDNLETAEELPLPADIENPDEEEDII